MVYMRLREALEEESGRPVVGARKVARIGWHKRTMINQYLAVTESLTRDVLRDAGILDAQGQAPEALVTGLKSEPLHKIAMLESREQRVKALHALPDRVRGVKPVVPKPLQEVPAEPSRTERMTLARDGEAIAIRVKAPVRTLAPDVAWRIAADEMTPALVALVERGGGSGERYLTVFENDHTVLVVPREVEQLSVDQLLRLTDELKALAKRVRRAVPGARGAHAPVDRTAHRAILFAGFGVLGARHRARHLSIPRNAFTGSRVDSAFALHFPAPSLLLSFIPACVRPLSCSRH